MKKNIIFLCGAKDFHAMDKFYTTAKIHGKENVTLVTDTVEGEGQKSLIRPGYKVKYLFIIDRFTLTKQTALTNIFRNILKFVVIPLQVFYLRRICKRNEAVIIHAIPMYYMLLSYLAGIKYIGTPQGSEILIRASGSLIYRFFAKKAITGASKVIVDSIAMKSTIKSLCGIDSLLIKNGFNTAFTLKLQNERCKRSKVLSIRGFHDIYRILEIISARNGSGSKPRLEFLFPTKNDLYKTRIEASISVDDKIHGSLAKENLYSLIAEALMVISIPASDSSPRSVYESIFCGAIVAMTYSSYYDELPQCMRQRIYLVNLDSETWFDDAMRFAQTSVRRPYIPSSEAVAMCDEIELTNNIIKLAYEL